MSKNQKRISNIGEIKPNIISLKPKIKDEFKTVGTARKSKSGNSLSIKLIAENRFFHISKKDVELILMDEQNKTVANVIEYARMEGN